LSVLTAAQPGGAHRDDDLLIPLTRNEVLVRAAEQTW
jgi:hypothetical protein